MIDLELRDSRDRDSKWAHIWPANGERVSSPRENDALVLTRDDTWCLKAHARAWLGSPLTFRFDNEPRDYAHVYLGSEQRQWLLGRVEPGARATLRIPEEALTGDPGSMRLAVLAGQRVTLRVAGEARAALTIAQPATEILSQRWTLSKTLAVGQLRALPLGSAHLGRQ